MKPIYEIEWAALSGVAEQAFEQLIDITGQVTGVPLVALPAGHQKMAGLQCAQWSGYAGVYPLAFGVTGVGELLLTRVDGSLLKAYAYPVGASGKALLLGSEFKRFSGHHSDVNCPTPVENLFGNIPWQTPSGSTGVLSIAGTALVSGVL